VKISWRTGRATAPARKQTAERVSAGPNGARPQSPSLLFFVFFVFFVVQSFQLL
jgi:hypothetical protein